MTEEQKPLEDRIGVLVIDDEPGILRLMQGIFSMSPYSIEGTATNGNEGISLYEKQFKAGTPPRIVITDLNMPQGSGDEVVKRVNELCSALPENERTLIYVVTGAEQGEAYQKRLERLEKAGPYTRISKPFSPMELLGIVGRGINKQQQISGENPPAYQPPTF